MTKDAVSHTAPLQSAYAPSLEAVSERAFKQPLKLERDEVTPNQHVRDVKFLLVSNMKLAEDMLGNATSGSGEFKRLTAISGRLNELDAEIWDKLVNLDVVTALQHKKQGKQAEEANRWISASNRISTPEKIVALKEMVELNDELEAMGGGSPSATILGGDEGKRAGIATARLRFGKRENPGKKNR